MDPALSTIFIVAVMLLEGFEETFSSTSCHSTATEIQIIFKVAQMDFLDYLLYDAYSNHSSRKL
jgi:hypothetical protein